MWLVTLVEQLHSTFTSTLQGLDSVNIFSHFFQRWSRDQLFSARECRMSACLIVKCQECADAGSIFNRDGDRLTTDQMVIF